MGMQGWPGRGAASAEPSADEAKAWHIKPGGPVQGSSAAAAGRRSTWVGLLFVHQGVAFHAV
eukprot:890347-Pyramimonas_sp.AAC.1